jgi:D-3-phosphoglycerate dehydrogenase
MRQGKIAGAALDVYPSEPGGNGDYFTNNLNPWAEDLRSLKNIILTPHIGGSTEEAQRAIGVEGKIPYLLLPFKCNANTTPVSEALVRYVNLGTTLGAVNLPEVNLRSLTLDESNHARVSYHIEAYCAMANNYRSSTSIITSPVFLGKVNTVTHCVALDDFTNPY